MIPLTTTCRENITTRGKGGFTVGLITQVSPQVWRTEEQESSGDSQSLTGGETLLQRGWRRLGWKPRRPGRPGRSPPPTARDSEATFHLTELPAQPAEPAEHPAAQPADPGQPGQPPGAPR